MAPDALKAATGISSWSRESNYCKQMLPLKSGDDLPAKAGNTNVLEGSTLTGFSMGGC